MNALIPLITQLLVTYGPAAETLIASLIQQWETTGTVTITTAQWAALTTATGQNATTHMATQLAAAGITATDPRYLALIALTQPKAS